MDRRKEPRFQVYAPATVAPLDDPEHEIEARLIDISGLGLRLITDIEFPEDQIITVETDQHLILADVRNCMPRGNKFGIGAERVHSAAKISLPQSASKAARNHALVEAYHRRLREELPAAVESEPVTRVPVERRVALAHPASPEPQHPKIATQAPAARLAATPAASMVAELEPITAEAVSTPLAPKEPGEIKIDSLQHLPFSAKPHTAPSHLNPVHDDILPNAILPEPPEPPLPRFTAAPTTDVRTLLGSQFEDAEPAPRRKPKILVAALCAVLALAVILLGPFAKRILFQTSVAASTPKAAAAAASTPAPIAVAPAPVATAPALAEAPPSSDSKPDPKPVPTKSTLSISSTAKSWITACSDGKVVFTKVLDQGIQQELSFEESAVVRVGRAGPVQIQLNGKSIGPLGAPGQIRAIQFGPDSWRFLKLKDPDGCTQ
jgi:hypothetical protein